MNGTGRLVAAARWDDKALPAVVFHADAKTRQQFQGDVDVGLGDEFALDINGDGLFLCQQGQAMSSEVKNWLETSPRTRMGAAKWAAKSGWPIFSGG